METSYIAINNNKKIICVIPTFNEEKTIENIINRTKPYCNEILVVLSKKSTDQTKKIVESMGIKNITDNGIGKGEALRCAIKYIQDGIIIFMDADGSHIPEDIPALVKPILEDKADMTIGNRYLGGSEELHGTFNKFLRMFFSMCISQIINWRFNREMQDTQNGFRAIKVNVAKDLDLKANIFDIEAEMVMKCCKKGYRIGEVPSRELVRKYGKSGLKLYPMGFIFFWRVLKNLF